MMAIVGGNALRGQGPPDKGQHDHDPGEGRHHDQQTGQQGQSGEDDHELDRCGPVFALGLLRGRLLQNGHQIAHRGDVDRLPRAIRSGLGQRRQRDRACGLPEGRPGERQHQGPGPEPGEIPISKHQNRSARKFQARSQGGNSKSQAPNPKHQIPNSKFQTVRPSLDWDLGFGIWDFRPRGGLGFPPPGRLGISVSVLHAFTASPSWVPRRDVSRLGSLSAWTRPAMHRPWEETPDTVPRVRGPRPAW